MSLPPRRLLARPLRLGNAEPRRSTLHLVVSLAAMLSLLAAGTAGAAEAPAQGSTSSEASGPVPTPARTGPPASVAVLGDSISQGTGTDSGGLSVSHQSGGIGSPRPRNSWATGDWPGLGSYLQRVQALPGGGGTVGINLSANGANMRNNFLAQAQSVPAGTGVVLVQMGGNDLCRPEESAMTPESEYRAQFRAGLAWLQTHRPETLISVFSVPDIYNLWYLRGAAHQGEGFGIWPFNSKATGPRAARGSADNGSFWARQFWDGLFGSVIPCKTLLVDPTQPRNGGPTPTMTHATEGRRLRVRARTQAYNAILAQECAAVLRCRFDDNATFDFASNRINGSLTHNTTLWRFVDRDISTQDHFHPSFHGQRKLAQQAFQASYDFRDVTAPELTVTPDRPANGNGWHSAEVGVRNAAADANGVRGYEHRVHQPGGALGPWVRTIGANGPPVTVVSEGVSHIETRALDRNGNQSATTILTVRLDKTAPQVHPATPADGATYVQQAQVAADFGCSDAGGSELASCAGTVGAGELIDTGTVGTKSFTITAIDHAGNETSQIRTYTVLDATPSAFDATDDAGDAPTLTGGHTTLDETPPEVTISAPLDGDVYTLDEEVIAGFTCADEDGGSGLSEGYCEGAADDGSRIDTSTLGRHSFTITATDRAGNAAEVTHTYTVIDGTAPTVSTPHEGIAYKLGQPVEALYACTDEVGGSDVARCEGPALLDTRSVGAKTLTVTSTDHAGNQRVETFPYRVIYAYGEIRQPINRDGSSVFQTNRTVPVTFQVLDYAEVPVSSATAMLATVRTYGGEVPTTKVREAAPDVAASAGDIFRYDSKEQQYVYNLSTRGMSPGAYQLFIRLDDGEEYTAVITLR